MQRPRTHGRATADSGGLTGAAPPVRVDLHMRSPMNTETDTQRDTWSQARVHHTHIFSSLSMVILGTVCLERRQAFREGEWTHRIPEMSPEVERCLLTFTWPGGVCDNGGPVPGLPWERGPRAGALAPRWPCFSNSLSREPDPVGPKQPKFKRWSPQVLPQVSSVRASRGTLTEGPVEAAFAQAL